MAQNLPEAVRVTVRDAIYRKADEFSYMHKNRIESGVFMENLVRDPGVGRILADFMGKDSIKTYIKDAVLNRYMKEKKKSCLPSDPDAILLLARKFFTQSATLIHKEGGVVFLFRLDDGDLLLIVQGTLIKWETALRKALEFIARSPGLPPKAGVLHTLLNIAVLGLPFTAADRSHLASALSHVGVRLHIADQP